MKILLLAGEESGELYARALRARLTDHEIRGYADYGFAIGDLAVIGYWAVLKKAWFFLRVKRTLERAIDEWKPDVVCTVDYPGMNLKLAAYAKSRGLRTIHVVCPQVWAWKQGRIPKIEAAFDRLCCFFPFEPALFKPGFATFVGHPLVADFLAEAGAGGPSVPRQGRLVALLPGSRLGEIDRILPTLLEAAARLRAELREEVRFAIPAASAAARARIDALVASSDCRGSVDVRDGGARTLLREADAAAVASGTATLEAALARCPTVLVYRVGAVLAWIFRRLITGTRYAGLANILWVRCGDGGEVPMPELLQEAFTAEATAEHLKGWLTDSARRAETVRRLDATVRLLGTGEDAFDRIIAEILSRPRETVTCAAGRHGRDGRAHPDEIL